MYHRGITVYSLAKIEIQSCKLNIRAISFNKLLHVNKYLIKHLL